jgi:helicase
MVGTMEPALDILASQGLVTRKGDRIVLSDLSKVMAEHFIGVERLNEILRLMETTAADPVVIVAELECAEEGERGKEPEKEQEKGRGKRGRR